MNQEYRDRFAALHVPGNPVLLYNIWDVASAQAVAAGGALALATGSHAVAEANGFPDGEGIPFNLFLECTRRIVEGVDLPVTADFEGGFAVDPAHVADHARYLAETGAVGCNFEDQVIGGEGLHPIAEQARRVAAVVDSSLGPMLVAASDKGVCRLSFGRGREELERLFPKAELVEGGADFAALLQRVVAAIDDPASGRDIPVDVRGTAFQERVWQELRRIPAGETRSYAEIAAAAGNPRAVRAAGSANGANHVPVLIPCHCVVRSDGSLGGYAYGHEIKKKLLERDGVK